MPATADAAVREPSLLQFKDFEPQAGDGLKRWVARGQNFQVTWLEPTREGAAAEIVSTTETMLLLPDAPATIAGAGGRVAAGARSICIVPAGRWTVQPGPGGPCIVLSSLAPGEAGDALNEAAYREPDARIAPVGPPFVRRDGGGGVRVIPIDDVRAPKDKPRLKMLQTDTLSINWVEYDGARDASALSPHSHASFEQGSLAIHGDFVHHLRVEWGPDATLWQDDRHERLGPASLLVVPVRMIHTTQGAGPGRHLLIDVFAPARADFIARGWVSNAGDYLPAGGRALTREIRLPRLARPAAGEMQVGTFVKTASPQVIEVLALAGLDFAAVDAEHAPFDRRDIDLLVLAGLAAGLPVVVRVDFAAPTLLSVLDVGAAGLLVPHVDTAEQARLVVARSRYRGGERGFSSSPRCAGYGTAGMRKALASDEGCMVLCQIESAQAVGEAGAIAQVDGVDALFIGRADLALSMGFEDTAEPAVEQAVDTVIAATLAAGKVVGMAVGSAAERDRYAARGASWFVVGSDQSLLRQGAAAIARRGA